MNVFISKSRIITYLNLPIVCVAIFLAVGYFCTMLGVDVSGAGASLLWISLCAGTLSLGISNNPSRAIICSASAALMDFIYYSFSGRSFGFVLGVGVAFTLSLMLRDVNLKLATPLYIIVAIIVGVLLGVASDIFLDATKWLAGIVKGNSFFYSMLSEVFTTIFGDSLNDMFYYRDYGGSIFINGEIVTGVVDAFLHGTASSTSLYLSGKYLVNLFLSTGLFVSLFSKVRDKYLAPFVASYVLCLLCGNSTLLSCFLVFYNPVIYLCFVLACGLCGVVCTLMKLNIGFEHSASLIELAKYGNRYGFFILVGVVFSVLMYFATAMVLTRFDFDNGKYLPRAVRELVRALGGERNILRLDNGKLYVSNPNLIDIIKVDCDIHGDEITLLTDDFTLLSQYF